MYYNMVLNVVQCNMVVGIKSLNYLFFILYWYGTPTNSTIIKLQPFWVVGLVGGDFLCLK